MLKTLIFSCWAKSSSANTINLMISRIKCTADISYYYEKCESESLLVVSDSFVIPWTIQSMEFSRPEYWSA